MSRYLVENCIKSFLIGISFGVGVLTTSVIAVTVSTTFNTGDTLTASSLNVLKTAIESIPGWSKGTTTTDAVYMDGNVGIGTTSPGTDNAQLHITDVVATARINLEGTDSTNGDTQIGFYRTGEDVFATIVGFRTSSGAGDIAFKTDDGTTHSEKVRITKDGNVGIGMTVPTVKLDIESSGNVDGIDINNTAIDGDPRLSFQLSGTSIFTMGVDDGDGDKFKIGTTAIDTNSRMTIDSSGNIGIGTVNPGTKLEVSGQVKITGGTPAAGEVLTSDATGLATWEVPSSSSVRYYASVTIPASSTIDFTVTQGAFTPELPASLSVVPTIEVFVTEVGTNYPGGTGGFAHNLSLVQSTGTPFNGSNPVNGVYLNVSINDKIRFSGGGNGAAGVDGTFKVMIIAIVP